MEAQQKQNEVPETLTPQQALAILVQGVQFGQSKGIYSLTDAELISKAVRVFTTQLEGKEAQVPIDVKAEEEPTGEPAEPVSAAPDPESTVDAPASA